MPTCLCPPAHRAHPAAPSTPCPPQLAPGQPFTPDGLPAVARLYNLYHPYDPVGHRCARLCSSVGRACCRRFQSHGALSAIARNLMCHVSHSAQTPCPTLPLHQAGAAGAAGWRGAAGGLHPAVQGRQAHPPGGAGKPSWKRCAVGTLWRGNAVLWKRCAVDTLCFGNAVLWKRECWLLWLGQLASV